MKLYSYWRSTTSLRVRAAMNLKSLDYDIVPVDLVAGDQRHESYQTLNPGKGVPTLVLDDGTVLTQSMAILDYLETRYPEPALLPVDPIARAKVRAAADQIALDIHPVNNLKVVSHLKSLGHSQDDAVAWMNHWMTEGFTAFQHLIRPDTAFCFGDSPGLADLCLVGQLYNARRWQCDLAPFGRLTDIDARCQQIDAIASAMPERQPDAAAKVAT
ncbi:maleylacetoacetate isomerase [Marinovum sp. 2_MG-2023]|uniref:maleylacetoacetate isomerase n=1 Tax=unclassified Marinovum TaxID=2647166 RepID=UPI0026E230B7|nr:MULTISPECIES: maleylacetoacetate isomerase [unclassified Marinovum]MDO6731781.1 maleylacetoacetate isomerase [Marinovum sp. 2_MG-2023]MDO6781033.1 maleylacetoacetate isomerase [Marinovum sp. 1_MG-2023]